MTKEEIKRIVLENKELLGKYKVKSIALFGSYVRNEQREDSDIDFLVEFGKGISLFDLVELQDALSEILGRNVSVVSKKGLSKYIGPDILREVEPIREKS